MLRYFMSIDEATKLVIEASFLAKGGEVSSRYGGTNFYIKIGE